MGLVVRAHSTKPRRHWDGHSAVIVWRRRYERWWINRVQAIRSYEFNSILPEFYFCVNIDWWITCSKRGDLLIHYVKRYCAANHLIRISLRQMQVVIFVEKLKVNFSVHCILDISAAAPPPPRLCINRSLYMHVECTLDRYLRTINMI